MPVVSRIAHRGASRRAGPAPIRWWDALPADFARRSEPFELGFRDRSTVTVTAASDVVLRTLGAMLVGGLAFPIGYHPLELKRALEDADFYQPLAESGDADRFFDAPPKVRIEQRPARRTLFSPEDGLSEDLSFESPFVPKNPRMRAPYLRHGGNITARARFWRHRTIGPRPTVIAVHGFSADLYHLNEWFFAIPTLYRLGADVLLFTLPFHGKRQTRFSPFSGHGFFAGGPSRINEAFAQAIFDLRIVIDWLFARGVPEVGITGVSLGGFTASLLAAVEPRLAFAIPNVPVISLADLVLEWEPIGAAVRASLGLLGRSIRDARRLLAVSTPLTYLPRLPSERLMIIGGVGDRLAPPKHAQLLWEHWDRCRIHWFPGSHLIHWDRGAYLAELSRFLWDIEFLRRR